MPKEDKIITIELKNDQSIVDFLTTLIHNHILERWDKVSDKKYLITFK